MVYKLLERIYIVENNSNDSKDFLLFNPYYNTMIKLTPDFKNRFTNSQFQPEEITALSSLEMLKNKEISELQFFKKWYFRNKFNTGNTRNYFLILTDLCNFNCSYCVEKNIQKHTGKISQELIKKSINFIKSDIETNSIKFSRITLFGGEPLLALHNYTEELIDLNKWLLLNNIKKEFYIVTNGSLLTPKKIELLSQISLNKIRITIDGLTENHNSNRPFKGGAGSFDIIMKNLENLKAAPEIAVSIGINVDNNNIQDVYELIDMLGAIRNSGVNIDGINIKPIMNHYGKKSQANCGSTMTTLLDKKFFENFKKLTLYSLNNHFKTPNVIGSTFCAMFTDGRDVAIGPDGNIYACPAAVGNPDFITSELNGTKKLLYNKTYHDKLLDYPEECLDCKYLPLCLGGCPYEAYSQTGSIHNKFCAKEYYDNYLDELIKLESVRVKTIQSFSIK